MAAKNKCLNKFAQLKYLYYLYKKIKNYENITINTYPSLFREQI